LNIQNEASVNPGFLSNLSDKFSEQVIEPIKEQDEAGDAKDYVNEPGENI